MTFERVVCIVGENAELYFPFQNGIPEDQIVDLQDDSTAVEEGLKTASGMIRDLSLPRVLALDLGCSVLRMR
jgi:hypothetical protein